MHVVTTILGAIFNGLYYCLFYLHDIVLGLLLNSMVFLSYSSWDVTILFFKLTILILFLCCFFGTAICEFINISII